MAGEETPAGRAQVPLRAAECSGENPAPPARKDIWRGKDAPNPEVGDRWDSPVAPSSAHNTPLRPALGQSPRPPTPPKTASISPVRLFSEERRDLPQVRAPQAAPYISLRSATR